MTDDDLALIRAEVFAASQRRHSQVHGERHWLAVAHAGLELSPRATGSRPLVVLLFSLFHDAMRENEYDDPGHGLRGADLSRRLLHDRLDSQGLDLLYEACRDHTASPTNTEPTIGACWDADRLNLWRVGTMPDPRFLSTAPARDPKMIRRARSFHYRAHDWTDLGRLALSLEATNGKGFCT